MDIHVELRPHTGLMNTQLGRVEITHAQKIIMAGKPDGPLLQVGYVATHPGAPINFLRQADGREWPKPIKDAVRAAVAEELGAGERRESQPPVPPNLREAAAAIDEDDEDD
jgi:hypothetical protein